MPIKTKKARKATANQPSNVDVDIQVEILNAARARLAVLNAQEIATYGVVKTKMADLGRSILANWQPNTLGSNHPGKDGEQLTQDGHPLDTRNYRRFPVRRETSPFRFALASATYAAAVKRLREHGMNVTRALDEGLEHFARTGKF